MGIAEHGHRAVLVTASMVDVLADLGQALHALSPGTVMVLLPLGIAGILSWSVWFVRRTLSHHAEPVSNDFRTTASVVVPVFREDPDVLSECLDTWLAETPDELILVVDLADDACLSMLAGRDLPDSVRVVPFAHQGKRSALGVGIRAANGEVVVLADSDTAWTPGLLREIQMPFADPEVGGVGTRQTVAARATSVWRRVASWLLNIRYLDYVPAMGARGCVPCLSGRTAAYRRSVILPVVDELEHEIFLGRECVAGDDGRLTWLVLSNGYKTVYQATAHAVSMFPDTFAGFVSQRLRWSRNSCRCYVTAAWKGWLWKQPFLTQVTVLQVVLTPLTMGIAVAYLAHRFDTGPFLLGLFFLFLMMVARGVRGLSHLREHPEDLVIVPLVTFVIIFISIPLKLVALVTMNRQGWITRRSDAAVPIGQGRATLGSQGVLS